jgi:hypothetical protein
MYNDGYAHLLTVIDVFSKYAWAVPLKSKSAENVMNAFRVILSKRKPLKIQSDKGTEFSNEKFKRFLTDRGIKYFTTNNPDVKAAVVERFNRTLKGRMYKYFTKFNTLNYVSVLPKLMKGYNDRIHSSTGVAPSEVSEKNAFMIARRLMPIKLKKIKFSIGDFVRISKERLPFAKGYTQNFSREVFKIWNIDNTPIPTYRLEDLNGERIKGSFYGEELVKTSTVGENTEFQIENILKRRGRGEKLEYLVKWKGYGDDFNTWISASEVRRLK